MRLWLPGSILLILSSFASAAEPAEPAEYSLRDAAGIRVDGRLNDWPSARRLEIGRAEDVAEGSAVWRGPETLSAKVFLTYDSEAFYLAAVVREDHPAGGAVSLGPPTGDSIEFALSGGWDLPRPSGWTRRDVIVSLSPGRKSKVPVAWLPARGKTAPGARIVAKNTPSGYLLEASMPWRLFPGAKVGPGKKMRFHVSLFGTGLLGEERVYKLELGRGKPAQWPVLRFEGEAVAENPDLPSDRSDPEAARIDEGLSGATFLGERRLTGSVVDSKGRPVPGACVWSWPASSQAWTKTDGTFELEKAKTYDRTVLLASGEELGTGCVRVPPKAASASVTLPESAPFPWGWGFVVDSLAETLPYRGRWWAWKVPPDGKDTAKEAERLVRLCRETGGEPCLFLRPGAFKAADGSGVKFWALLAPDPPGNGFDYLNGYRTDYLALKTAHAGSWVMGPGMDASLADAERLFLRYDGDAADMVLLRYPVFLSPPAGVGEAVQALRNAVNALSQKRVEVGSQLDRAAPVAIWLKLDVPRSDKTGYGQVHCLMSLLAFWAQDPSGPLFLDCDSRTPSLESPMGRAVELLSGLGTEGRVLKVRDVEPGTRVAARLGSDGQVSVLVANESLKQPSLVHLSLSGSGGRPSVAAGRKQSVEFVVPPESAAVVVVPEKGRAHGKCYGSHQAERREPLRELVIQ